MFGLLLYWGLISLPATMRRDGILPGTSDVMGSISHSLYFFFFFFWIENLWACRERATYNGLAVGLVLLFFFIFSDFSSNYFWVFFFFA